jgi:hypothetical protein
MLKNNIAPNAIHRKVVMREFFKKSQQSSNNAFLFPEKNLTFANEKSFKRVAAQSTYSISCIRIKKM